MGYCKDRIDSKRWERIKKVKKGLDIERQRLQEKFNTNKTQL